MNEGRGQRAEGVTDLLEGDSDPPPIEDRKRSGIAGAHTPEKYEGKKIHNLLPPASCLLPLLGGSLGKYYAK